MSNGSDFNIVCQLISEFCKTKKVIDFFTSLDELPLRGGFEKWIEVEFYLFLSFLKKGQDRIREVKNQCHYPIDQRKSPQTKRVFVDICFEIKRHYKELVIALEFKASQKPESCINGMIQDWMRLDGVRKSKDNMRSLWVVGFHPVRGLPPKNAFKKEIRKQLQDADRDFYNDCFERIKIGKTDFVATVF